MSNLRPIQLGNLRTAPASLTPVVVGRFLDLADQLTTTTNQSPTDASIAASGRTNGDFHAPIVAAEAGRSRLHQGDRPVTTEQKIIDAMRAAPGPRWTMKSLAHAAGISAVEARDTVQKMRWSGKMQFDRLELSASLMVQEVPAPRASADQATLGETAKKFSRAPSAPARKNLCDEHARATATVPPVLGPTALAKQAEDADRALQFLLADYLRPEQPAFTTCFLRLSEWARVHDVKLPSASTMRRRVNEEIARGASSAPAPRLVSEPARIEAPSADHAYHGPSGAQLVEGDEVTEVQAEPAPAAPDVPTPVFIGVDLASGPDMHVEHVPEHLADLLAPSSPDERQARAARVLEEVSLEAAEAGARRNAARVISGLTSLDKAPASIAEAVATGMVEDLEDAMLAAKRAWPDQWWRIVARARSSGERPGVVFADVVQRGLDSLVAAR